MFELSHISTFHLNAKLRVKPINMICNKTILENVFLQDLSQYINDYIITREWYLIDGNNGPDHAIPGGLNHMCARPGSSLGKYMCVCVSIFPGVLSTVRYFHFIFLIISIISAICFLSSVNTYINSASIVIFLFVLSSLPCGKMCVCMFFHL